MLLWKCFRDYLAGLSALSFGKSRLFASLSAANGHSASKKNLLMPALLAFS